VPAPIAVASGPASASAIYEGFKAQRQELSNQLNDLEGTRSGIASQLEDMPVSSPERKPLEARLTDIDSRIKSVDQRLAANALDISKAAAVPGAVVEPPPEDGQPTPPGLGGFGAAGGLGGLSIELPVSVGGGMSFSRIGTVTVPFAAGARRLELYWMAGYAGGLFLPFRDATNGTETYGAGRYLLDAAKSADLGPGREPGTLVLDFNFAFQPSCAFDPKYACPLSPPANRLDLPVRAGERLA